MKFQQVQEFEDKLWLCGTKVGEVTGKFRFINVPFMQQMRIGVMSNTGVTFSSKPLLYQDSNSNSSAGIHKMEYFKEMLTLIQKLTKHDRHVTTLNFADQMQVTKRMREILETTEKDSMISFIYEKEQDLITA